MPSYDGRPTIRGCGLLPRPRPKPTFSRRCGRCIRPWSQTGSPSTVAWTSPSTATAPAAGRVQAIPTPVWRVACTTISSRARNPDDAADRARPVCRGLRRHLPRAGVSTLVLDVRRPTLGGDDIPGQLCLVHAARGAAETDPAGHRGPWVCALATADTGTTVCEDGA